MTGPTLIVLDADAQVTVFLVRVQVNVPQSVIEDVSIALDDARAIANLASFDTSRGTDFFQIRVRAKPEGAAHALRTALHVVSSICPTAPVPMAVIGRGRLVSEAISTVDWAPNVVPSKLERPPLSPGAHFELSSGRLRGRVGLTAAVATSRNYAFQNAVASVWIGTRDSVVMQGLRERAGLLYFPFMTYDWHPTSPSWSIELQAEAGMEAAIRRELYVASETPPPVDDLAMHLRNAVRSLDVVEISPAAHLALGQQLADRGLTGEWVVKFRRALEETTTHDFASEWRSMMTQIQEALGA